MLTDLGSQSAFLVHGHACAASRGLAPSHHASAAKCCADDLSQRGLARHIPYLNSGFRNHQLRIEALRSPLHHWCRSDPQASILVSRCPRTVRSEGCVVGQCSRFMLELCFGAPLATSTAARAQGSQTDFRISECNLQTIKATHTPLRARAHMHTCA